MIKTGLTVDRIAVTADVDAEEQSAKQSRNPYYNSKKNALWVYRFIKKWSDSGCEPRTIDCKVLNTQPNTLRLQFHGAVCGATNPEIVADLLKEFGEAELVNLTAILADKMKFRPDNKAGTARIYLHSGEVDLWEASVPTVDSKLPTGAEMPTKVDPIKEFDKWLEDDESEEFTLTGIELTDYEINELRRRKLECGDAMAIIIKPDMLKARKIFDKP